MTRKGQAPPTTRTSVMYVRVTTDTYRAIVRIQEETDLPLAAIASQLLASATLGTPMSSAVKRVVREIRAGR